jgi:hypothetical protein
VDAMAKSSMEKEDQSFVDAISWWCDYEDLVVCGYDEMGEVRAAAYDRRCGTRVQGRASSCS